jgi:hypothetical protein
MSLTTLVFHAKWLDPRRPDALLEIVDRHLAEIGVRHDPTAPAQNGSCYSTADGVHAGRSYPEGDGFGLLWFDEPIVKGIDPDRLADMLTALSVELGAALTRTDSGYARATIRDDELSSDGHVRTLHWFQYFGPSIAARWPPEAFDRLPDCRVTRCDGSGVAIRFDGSPGRGNTLRFAAAALGIVLQPVKGRNPATGALIDIPIA